MKTKIRLIIIMAFILTIFNININAEKQIPTLPQSGNTIESFVPTNWTFINKTYGDLNKDGLVDFVGVIEYTGEEYKDYKKADPGKFIESPPRILFCLFQNSKGRYVLSVQTDEAILGWNQGGARNPEPFQGISIDRGSFIIHFYGGSAWAWTGDYRFRFQDNGWYLIGVTRSSFHVITLEGSKEDYNLLTGIMIKTETNNNEKTTVKKINRGKKKLVNLLDFSFGSCDF